jgi:hypothetical protein
MAAYEIRPFDQESVPEIARFLFRSLETLERSRGTSGDDAQLPVQGLKTTHDHRWLLDEGNPARSDGIVAGEILRNGQGAVVGMLCYRPRLFRIGERQLLGLGASNFFVDPSARMQGFTLFRRYLNTDKADFCFSTTCNANSGPLWSKCGAAHVPDSNFVYVLVLRHAPLIEELAIRKGVPRILAAPVRLAGPPADLILGRFRRRSCNLRIERCDDWERLAAIAERNRDRTRVTPERSVALLRHHYEARSRTAELSGSLDGVFRFTASCGREGWLSVGERLHGHASQIRSLDLLDLVWPSGSIGVSEIIVAVSQMAGSRADCLNIQGYSSWELRPGLIGLRRQDKPAPEAFVFCHARSGFQPPQLAQLADFPRAFGA